MPTPTATLFLPYHALDDVIQRGTRAAQPAASAVVPGTLYSVTDEASRLERSDGTAWALYAPTGGGAGGGPPDSHHATHEPGGSDALVHAAWTTLANTFTLPQTIGPASAGSAYLQVVDNTGEGALIVLTDAGAPVDHRTFYIRSQGGGVSFQSVTDVGAVTAAFQSYNGELIIRPPTGGIPQVLFSKDLADSDPSYPRLQGAAGQMEFRRFDNTGRILVLASGLGDTPLNASQVTSGTLPDARLSANVQLKPIAATDLPAHATRHQPGGVDALAVDAAAATGSLRTLGTGAQQAAPGNDARFGAPTTPTAHHATHETGGTDALTALSGGVITSGTVADARLSANVALLASPVFTGDPKAPTPTAGDNDTSLATTAFVQAAITGQARFNVSLVNSVAQSIPASTFTVLTFNSETFDVGNLHDPAVNPSRITVPAGGAGLWLLTAVLTWSGSAGGVQRQGLLNKNGGTNLMTSVVAPSANYEPQNILTVCVQLAVGEYVELMGYQDSGAALTTSYPKTVLTAARLF